MPLGWISDARSSSSAVKTIAIIGSITSKLRLGHKKYHYVVFQSLYTTPPETSLSDHPCATMHRSKFLQKHPHATRAINIALILSLLPLSESLKKNRPHQTSHAPSRAAWISLQSKLHATSVTRTTCCPLTSLAGVICHINPSCSSVDITYWRHHPIST